MSHFAESTVFTESVVEDAALAWLESFGCSVRHGLENAPNESKTERIIGRVC